MKKSTCLILGSCFILQAIPAVQSQSVARASLLTADASGDLAEAAFESRIPLHYREHARELMKGERELASETYFSCDLAQDEFCSYDLSDFVHKRTKRMLPKSFKAQAPRVAKALIKAANKHQMDPLFLMAVIFQESSFNPKAKGRHGEIGLMQLKPTTVRWMLAREDRQAPSVEAIQKQLLDPVMNIKYGAEYLSYLREMFDRKSRLYISAYNMGASMVRAQVKSGNHPRIYSQKILTGYRNLSEAFETVRTAKLRFIPNVQLASTAAVSPLVQ